MSSQTTDRARQLLLVQQDPAEGALRGRGSHDEPAAVAMRERIMADSGTRGPAHTRDRRHLRLTRTTALATIAAALVVVTAAAVVSTRATPALAALPIKPVSDVIAAVAPVDRADERAALLRLAAQAEDATPVRVPATVTTYEGWLQTSAGERSASRLVTLTRTLTANADGTGSDVRQAAKPIWPSAEDRERWVGAGAPPEAADLDATRATGELNHYSSTLEGLAPAELQDKIAGEVKSDSPDETDVTAMRLNHLTDAFAEPTASPALRASLLKVAAEWPALEVRPGVIDQLGRTGTSISIVSDYSGAADVRYELILDAESGALLQHQDVLLEPVAYVQATPPVQLSFSVVAQKPKR